jgi:hypothetical protein
MSGISKGASPVLEFARSVLEIARRRWRERAPDVFTAPRLKFAPIVLRIAPAGRNQRGTAPESSGGATFDVSDIDRIIGRANFSTAQQRGAQVSWALVAVSSRQPFADATTSP